jgi:16S rRNA (uracil1498-N3)-methyltransferase
VKLDPERAKKRHLHWQRIAVAACMQCGQDQLPKIEAPLPARIAFSDRVSDPGQRLILDPLAQDSLVQTVRSRLVSDQATDQAIDQANDQAGRGRWVMAVGPESGFDPDEIEAAKRAGFKPVRIGPRILRTETAGPAAIAALQTLCGDF